MSFNELSSQEIQRRETLNKLRAMGIEPYPAALYPVTDHASEIKKSFEENKQVVIAGRLMSQRVMGKASFAEIQDSTGRIQVYFNRDEICPGEDKTLYNEVFKKLLDLGDFIGIKGYVFKTQVGEISVHVQEFTLLAKSLKPLPVAKIDEDGKVHDAFTDPELRYRQRYVDLVVNPHVKETFIKRTKAMNSMRQFFTHHNALDMPLYLRVANELYLKRLIVGGFEGVYEFAKDFRNEGMDRTHNPEFTVMEIYVAYKDYNWMMDFTEQMIEKVAMDVCGETNITVGDNKIELKAPYARVTMRDAILNFTGFDISGKSEKELADACKSMGIEVDESMGKGKLIDELFGEKCEANYIQPTFITDYPVEMSPLCKKHRDNPELTERFELMINGKEVANAYTELNDPIDQRGIDRLVMLLTNNSSIQEVLFFPQMRIEKFNTGPDLKSFEAIGVPQEWTEAVYKAGYESADQIKESKATAVHQKLNGYRKKMKLEIPALLIEDVEKWFA